MEAESRTGELGDVGVAFLDRGATRELKVPGPAATAPRDQAPLMGVDAPRLQPDLVLVLALSPTSPLHQD